MTSGLVSVGSTAAGTRAVADIAFGKVAFTAEERLIVYDAAGTPELAWRVTAARSPDCILAGGLAGSKELWVGAQRISDQGATQADYAVGAYAGVASISQAINIHIGASGQKASDDVFAFGVSQPTIAVYDRLSDSGQVFGTSTLSVNTYHPFAGGLLAMHSDTSMRFDARLWTHATHKMTPLIQHPTDDIVEANSDGSTLLWIQVPHGTDSQGWSPQGNLWTSPMATTAAALQPTLRRAAPIVSQSGVASLANAGYYVFSGSQDLLYHVYRIADAHHWSFSAQVPDADYGARYVDADEVWYQDSKGFYRQSIAALGPGDSSP
jgi:hypothetical protein